MKKSMSKFLSTGIWAQPIWMYGIVTALKEYIPQLEWTADMWLSCGLLSMTGALMPALLSINQPKESNAYIGKQKAMYPEINKNLLHNEPTGILLGKDKSTNKYVCKNLDEDGHVFLIGGSGSGKSSCYVIPSLISNPSVSIFAVDIKGELSFKATRYSDEHVLIFNPADRSKYGYNALYNLDSNSSTQAILETMQNISYSLISLPAAITDPFWKTSARNLLIGLLIFYYREGIVDFVSIIDKILEKPVKEAIEDVMQNASKESVEYRYIVQFSAMEDETLGGIVAEMNNHIVIFANDQDIRYAFKENSLKLNPHKLEEKYSIYLSIKEEKLSAYYDVMQLIINQTLAELEKRPEDAEPIIMCIDELPRILSAGKLDRLLDAVRTLRSRKVCLFLITQSTEALMSAFTENEVADLISNCSYIIVLSASSSKTQKSICEWCGKYKARKQTWNGTGSDTKISVSYEDVDIVEPSDLMTLKNTGEAIIITPFGYSRLKKVPWYKDKDLKIKVNSNINKNKVNKESEERYYE